MLVIGFRAPIAIRTEIATPCCRLTHLAESLDAAPSARPLPLVAPRHPC